MAGLAAAGAAAAPSSLPRVGLADSASATPAERRLVAADAAWLADLPPASAAAVPDTADRAEAPWFLDRGRGGEPSARSAASLLRDRWEARGYLACRVASVPGDGRVDLTVAPGSRFRTGTVTVGGEDFPGRDAALRRWLPHEEDPVDAAGWEAAVDGLLTAAVDAGRPFARWVVREARVDAEEARLDVAAVLVTGPPQVFGPVTSDLPAGRGNAFLVKAARLPVGSRFSESALREARNRLLQRDLYASVGEPVVYTTAAPGTVGVFWRVRTVPHPNRAAVVLGLRRASADAPSRVSGRVDLSLANLAGTGRGLDLAWSDDGVDRSHFGFTWREPLIAGTPLDAAFAVDHEVVRDVHARFRLDGRLSLPVTGPWGLELGVGWDRSTYPVGAWTATRRWRAGAGFVRRRLDRGRSGWSGRVGLESARRGADLRVGQGAVPGAAAGESRQTLVEVDLGAEHWLGGAVSAAVRGLWREVRGDGQPIPLSEQYRLGGARTLRGYMEDEFHGERVGAVSGELRLGRPGRSRVYTFYDLGYVRTTVADALDPSLATRHEAFPRGFGLGIETASPAGTISLAIGFPGTFQFDTAKLHVTLLQSF